MSELTSGIESMELGCLLKHLSYFSKLKKMFLYCSNSRSASLVISSQFGGAGLTDIPDYVFMENPITLNFSFTSVSPLAPKVMLKNVRSYICI